MMKIRTKFILFMVVIHIIVIGLSFFIFKSNKLLFIFSEIFILVSIYISWQLYRDLIAPIRLLMTGVNAIRDKDFNVKFLKVGKLEMDELIDVYNGMVDQLRQERTRQEQQHYFLEKLVQTSPTGILILDFDDNIANINPKVGEILNMNAHQLVGKSVFDFDHPLLQAISTLKTGESRTIALNGIQTYKCQKSHFIDRGFPRYFIMIEELTVEILNAEKKAYGKVIRMMAHEVNNSIGSVNSILDTTVQMQEHDSELKYALEIAIQRNNHLNHFMRNFADMVRLPEPRPVKSDLNELLRNSSRLMEYKASQLGIRIEAHLTEMPFFIMADVHQLEQVIINIIKNAIEAIELRKKKNPDWREKGQITISNTYHPKQLLIEDNGSGISTDAEQQIFSPFFTTKENGQGIGLTLIREILVNHGFQYSLKTNPDRLTVFRIGF
ncbi:PAS domain-containing sensor histidine kinase [Emticicia sp. TH156]|uniref:sensor histidine kinase n=1 Tax=Emticicia sp. TH156 TaxID=2067454 RepID=UPI001E5799BB|nr:ATP-binding protein [Emticicia sp. TH156]